MVAVALTRTSAPEAHTVLGGAGRRGWGQGPRDPHGRGWQAKDNRRISVLALVRRRSMDWSSMEELRVVMRLSLFRQSVAWRTWGDQDCGARATEKGPQDGSLQAVCKLSGSCLEAVSRLLWRSPSSDHDGIVTHRHSSHSAVGSFPSLTECRMQKSLPPDASWDPHLSEDSHTVPTSYSSYCMHRLHPLIPRSFLPSLNFFFRQLLVPLSIPVMTSCTRQSTLTF